MKLVTYRFRDAEHVGALTADGTCVAPLPFADMNALIETASPAQLRTLAAQAEEAGAVIPVDQVTLLAPIPRPRQDVLCLGMNYRDHEAEAARYDADAFTKEKPVAVYFSKRVNEAVAPGGNIPRHAGLVEKLDYEVELGVILGKTARDVPAEQAAEYIFGYTIINDVSARDLQTGHKQWYFGKSLDGFTPMGPCIVTADEIAFPPALEISSAVNREPRQHSNTRLFLTDIPTLLAELTAGMTLLPGTIIATGTPAGVGMGFDPPRFLSEGDTVSCTIEGIGTLTNTVR
ncbi:fumarylacetoacetate hydrolase family protein [uncultured Oscillibacter sp.]|uniref:fumarylacetoacetate hydrolase family protein n=1 Tax=uncultured Oscillibacter sp. TaxID=876091 RepID=UPI0025D70713|nr:fumarylacetoacetate hydrolase family protein [uncultured Oscillibacter sp.]